MSSSLQRKRLEMAIWHVCEGRHIVEQQKTVVEQEKLKGCDTTASENILILFERALAIFEEDYEAVQQEFDR